MEQSPFPLAHMESPWVEELQPPTPATLDMDLLDKQPGLAWILGMDIQEHGVEMSHFVWVSIGQRKERLYKLRVNFVPWPF